MFDVIFELKDKIAVIGVGNTKYGNFPTSTITASPRRGEQSGR